MGKHEKLLLQIIQGRSDRNTGFEELRKLLPGCTAHGNTYESSLSNAQDAIQFWLDTAKEHGEPIPESQGRKVMLAYR